MARLRRFFFRSAKSSDTTPTITTTTNTFLLSRTSSQYTDGPGTLTNNDSRSNSTTGLPLHAPQPQSRKRSASLSKLREKFLERGADVPSSVQEVRESVLVVGELPQALDIDSDSSVSRRSGSETLALGRSPAGASGKDLLAAGKEPSVTELKLDDLEQIRYDCPPAVVLEESTPDVRAVEEEAVVLNELPTRPDSAQDTLAASPSAQGEQEHLTADPGAPTASASSALVSPHTHPVDSSVRQQATARVVTTLIDAPPRPANHDPLPSAASALPTSAVLDYFTPSLPDTAQMLHRKIWVRRPGASATLVQIREDDLVDDVREMILKKYKNSLGGTFDAPDMTLRIVQRAQGGQLHERTLGPEEEMCRTIDSSYPGGQTVNEALVIDVPVRERRTPRPSPRYQHPSYQALDDYRPLENGTEYFPPMPAIVPPSMPQTTNSHDSRTSGHAQHSSVASGLPGPLEPHQRSISVLNTGQIPPLPSPGGTIRPRGHRPKYHRQHTSSPNSVQQHPTQHPSGVNAGAVAVGANGGPPSLNVNPQHPLVHRSSIRPRNDSQASDAHHTGTNGVLAPSGPAPQPPTPPAPEQLAPLQSGSTPPTPSSSAPGGHGLRLGRPKKGRKSPSDKTVSGSRPRHQRDESLKANGGISSPKPASSVLDGSVPPINVLIVEDNIINLRILEGLMKRLRVRWQTAMNGQIAVDKWRGGGYHLVLMDIQMPVMNGLAATKEIRRLERVNGIGVFSAESGSVAGSPVDKIKKLGDVELPDIDGSQNPIDTTDTFTNTNGKGSKDDRLSLHEGLFKSPVIIVALTASSLQSDRHEALAAGCNDFLTKPVNFVWLERKVKEWGCMQALIDFDGWRKWKEFAAREEEGKTDEQREQERLKAEKEKRRMEKMAVLQEKQRVKKEEEERENRWKRANLLGSEGGTAAMTGGAGEGGADGVSVSEG